ASLPVCRGGVRRGGPGVELPHAWFGAGATLGEVPGGGGGQRPLRRGVRRQHRPAKRGAGAGGRELPLRGAGAGAVRGVGGGAQPALALLPAASAGPEVAAAAAV